MPIYFTIKEQQTESVSILEAKSVIVILYLFAANVHQLFIRIIISSESCQTTYVIPIPVFVRTDDGRMGKAHRKKHGISTNRDV